MIKTIVHHIFHVNKRDFLIAFFAFITLLAFIPVFTYAYFSKDLITKESIMNRKDTGLMLLDRDNKPFFTFYEAKQKDFVPLSMISLNTQEAIIAAEDKEFYSHPGFSIRGILRSLFKNVEEAQVGYGGSTITQQLVKNALLTPKKSYLRKYQEIVLASEIERRYNKKEILEMYLNSVYFGEGAFGVEEAAQKYFGKSVKNITLAESSYLAAILPAPSELSSSEADGKERQRIVLKRMLDEGYITREEKEKAEKESLVFRIAENHINKIAPHFALLVRDELIKKFGEETISRSGFRVKTTLNTQWQEYAENVVKEQVEKLSANRVSNGAVVVIDPKNGEVKTLVGSKDWYDNTFGKVNIATSLRQPGSAFKPLVYIAALEKGIITPASVLKDQPTTFPVDYKPQNYDKRFRGPVTVRRALANSLNVPSVEVMSKVGLLEALDMAKRLEITTLQDPSQYGLSLVLGTGEVKLLELTNVYATFANNGQKYPPTFILEIIDKNNTVIHSYKPSPKKVLTPSDTFLISSILSDNKARAEVFGNALTISRPAAVKTGTTENYRDAWTLGYTPSLAIGVWVGNNDNREMDNIAGSLGAAPIWRELMEKFLTDTPVENFSPPSDIITKSICGYGSLASSSAYIEYFVQGTEPAQPCIITPTVPAMKQQQRVQNSTITPSSAPLPTLLPTVNSNNGQQEKEEKRGNGKNKKD